MAAVPGRGDGVVDAYAVAFGTVVSTRGGKPTVRVLSAVLVHWVGAGQGWHWLLVNRATTRVEDPLRGPLRSGGHVNEFAHGYGMRRCRYRGQGKAHIQHVLTAIAVNIERLSGLPPTEEAPMPRRPTAVQDYLDQRDIPRPKSWRTLGS
ncbi:transposase [Streptomyces lavendulae]|uniref:transposase n=1 Tax=Streptomyces lavendulae TaxID=1914 RepID=UPI00336E0657